MDGNGNPTPERPSVAGGTFTITNGATGQTSDPIPYNATPDQAGAAAKSVGIAHLGLAMLSGTVV